MRQLEGEPLQGGPYVRSNVVLIAQVQNPPSQEYGDKYSYNERDQAHP